MGFLGGLFGKGLGWLGEKAFGKTRGIDGQELGENLGSKFIPFKRGGKVKKPRKKAKKTKSKSKSKAKK